MTKILASVLMDPGYGNFDYGDLADLGMDMLLFLGGFYLLMIGISIAMYVLESLGLYTIAKRRGIHHSWLSWIPVAKLWIFGSISDQYQYVAKGKVHNRRKSLIGMTIATYALMIPFYILYFIIMAKTVGAAFEPTDAQIMELMSVLLGFLAIAFVIMVVSIVQTVFTYMTWYSIFMSCEPDNGVMYLVLGIFFSFLMPIFLFICRKKDLGMPPRKPKLHEAAEAVPEEEAPAEEAPQIEE